MSIFCETTDPPVSHILCAKKLNPSISPFASSSSSPHSSQFPPLWKTERRRREDVGESITKWLIQLGKEEGKGGRISREGKSNSCVYISREGRTKRKLSTTPRTHTRDVQHMRKFPSTSL